MELIKLEDGTLQCSECGTRIRPGQPHTAIEPTPHQSYEALTVNRAPDFEALEQERLEEALEDLRRRRDKRSTDGLR
jgi:hypothetical protein